MSTDYVTTYELADFLSGSTEFDPAELALPVSAASRGIDAHCRRRFYLDVDGSGDPDDSTRVFYPVSPVTCFIDDASTVTTVKTDAAGDGTFETTWASTDWIGTPVNGIGNNGQPGWPVTAVRAVEFRTFPQARRPTVQVTAAWGWAAIPDDVKMACLLAAKDLYATKDERGGLITVGDFVAAARRNPTVLTLLAPFCRHKQLVG